MSNENKCPICGEETVISKAKNTFGKFFSCNHCGRIHIEQSVYETLLNNEDLKLKSCLYFYLTHLKKGKVDYLITNIVGTKSKDNKVLQVKEIKNLYPDNISDRIDMILLNFSKFSRIFGEEFIVPEENYLYLFFIKIENKSLRNIEKYKIRKMLEDLGYLDFKGTQGGPIYEVTLKGWKRIDEISKKYKSYKKAFIAMSFKDELNPIREKIKEAIVEMGYIHSIIDEKEHNEFIVPEIIHEIETSDFVVADLTGNRGGVYFEAGYAMALGKTLILTVDERLENEEPHFDVAQINQVRYKDEEDLKKKLMRRIEATIGKVN